MESFENLKILVTGSTDGIGKRTAFELANRGATVFLHGRDLQKGEAAFHDIMGRVERKNPEYSLAFYQADFESLEEVRKLARDIMTAHASLDVVVNNAGIGPGPPRDSRRRTSRDGHELRFAVNYLAPFLLTRLLLPLLRNAPAARVVNIASAAQKRIDFDDVMLEREYERWDAYSQSKLAMVMFTFELAERLEADKITANCLHPGTLLDTKMVREASMAPQGAAQTGAEAEVHLATSPEMEGTTGKYFEGKNETRANAQAYDSGARERLWSLSEKLVGL